MKCPPAGSTSRLARRRSRLRPVGLALAWLACGALALTACDRASNAAARVQSARSSMAAGDFNRAIIQLKSLLQSRPDDGEARLALSEASLGAGDVASAAKEVARARQLGVASNRTEPLRWKIELAAGHYAQVLEGLSRPDAELLEPRRTTDMALALIALGRPAEAVERLEALTELDEEARLALGNGEAAIGRTDVALRLLDNVTTGAYVARAKVLQGEILIRAGRHAEAMDAFRATALLAEQAHDKAALFNAESALIDFELSRGQLDAARNEFAKLKVIAANSAGTQTFAARIAIAEGRFADAADILGQVIRVVPNAYQAGLLLAIALVDDGRLEQGESQLEQVLQLRPDDSAARRMLADVQIRQGRATAAQRTLEKLDVAVQGEPATLLMMARAALAAGDAKAALRNLDRAAAASADDAPLRLEIASAFLQAGAADRAVALLDGMPAAGEGAYRAKLLHALALLSNKHPADAAEEIARYARDHANDAEAQDVAGTYFVAARQPDLARKYFNAALAESADDARALSSLAQLEFSARRFDAATALLNRWNAVHPNTTAALMGLARVAATTGDSAAAQRWLEQAKASDRHAVGPLLGLTEVYVGAGNLAAARAQVSEALALDSRRIESLRSASVVEERAGDLPRAAEFLRRAVDVAPAAYDLWANLGRVRLAANDLSGARDAFERALVLRPGWWPAVTGLADSLERTGDFGGVDATIQALQAKAETRAQGWVLEGRVLEKRRDFAAAAKAFGHALELDPNPWIVAQRYRVQMAANPTQAEADLRAWLSRRPEDAPTRMLLAGHLERRGDAAAAIEQYQEAVRRDPRNAAALNNLALLYQQTGDARAIETARSALRVAPNEPLIADTLGWVLVKGGAGPEGLEYLNRAVAARSTDPEIQYHYGFALARSGRKVEALEALDRALNSGAGFPSRSEAVQLRAQLQPGA